MHLKTSETPPKNTVEIANSPVKTPSHHQKPAQKNIRNLPSESAEHDDTIVPCGIGIIRASAPAPSQPLAKPKPIFRVNP
jgi:hypothetical protein